MRFIALVLIAAPLSAQVALDSTCVVSTLNRSTRVLADGSWVLPNVPSNFGSIRVRANCVDDGVSRAGQSGFVRVPPGGTLHVSDIVFDAPRQIPARLTLRSPRALLTSAGESIQLEAIATLPDGALADVTEASTGTDYRISNPAIASVSGDGLVTAIASGTVLVAATHEGTLGVVELTIVAAADSDGDGLPDDFEIENDLDPLNDADAQRDPDADGLSIGDEFRRGLDPFDADTDDDGLDDGREVLVLGTDGLRFDTDGDGLSDGLEIELGTDPLDRASFDYAAALVSLEVRPAAFAIVFNTVLGDASAQLTVVGSLRDGSSIDLTSSARGTTYLSSDLAVCVLGVEPGKVFAGQPGECTITVASAGRMATARGIVQTFSPRLLSSVAIPGSANALDVVGDHAFVAAGNAGLQIVDVRSRRAPAIVGSMATAGTANDIAVSGTTALVAAGAAGVEVIDVGTPASPRRLATLPLSGAGRSVAVAEVIAVVVADAAPSGGTLFVVDTANPASPSVLGSSPTAGVPCGVALDPAGAIAVVAEGPLGVEVFDLTDPARPAARGRVAIGDARAVALSDGYALVADAASSLTVVDLRDLAQPRVAATVPRELGGVPVDVARFDGLAFTADIGFFAEAAVPIFDVTDPAVPLARARLALPTSDPGRGVDADATYVYLVACDGCDGASNGRSHLDVGQYRSLRDQHGVAPSITLVSPRDGDIVTAGSSLPVLADASDDVGVLAVELLVDGAVVGRDERPPYGATVTVPDAVERLTVGARAFDFAANSAASAEVEVLVARAGTTAVTGLVVGPRDEPVPAARVVVFAGAAGSPAAMPIATTFSDSSGAFSALDLMVGATLLTAQASAAIDGGKHRGGSVPVVPAVGGTTDLGVIRLEPIEVLYPGPRVLTGSGTQATATGDFDGDGIGDLAVLHAGTTSGLAILGGRRDGRFVLRQRLAIGGGALAAGDLTLDGEPDLVVGLAGGRALVLRNDGGEFEMAEDHALGAGAGAGQPRIGDFDSDGQPDVLFASVPNRNLALAFGNGDGTLRGAALFPLPGAPEDTALGDFDLDGRLDVAVATSNASAPHAVIVLRGDGAGGFGGSISLPFSLAPVQIEAGHFDHDGRLDLAIGAGRDETARAFVELGRGDGTFALASTVGVALLAWPVSMAIDDLDADGALDLAVGRNRPGCSDLLLVRGDGAGSFFPNQNRVITDHCAEPPRVALLDQTGDDLPEVLALDDNGVTTYLSLGSFAFERRLDLVTSKPVERVAAADLDRDGRLDLVYGFDAGKALGIQLGNGDGTFRAAPDLTTAVFVNQFALGDVDRDGDVDVAIASFDEVGVLTGRGDGTFVATALRPIDRLLSSLSIADVSSDGAGDVIATNETTSQLVVFESRGDGTLAEEASFAVGGLPRAVVIADLDGDGFLDVAVANSGSDDVSILLGTGDGAFAPQERYPADDQPLSIVAADFDLDGDVDLAVAGGASTATPSTVNVRVLLGDGEGAFIAQPRISTATFPTRLGASDVDLDGVADLLLLHQTTNDLSMLLGAGDGTFLPAERARTGQRPWWLEVADVDGDGRPDLMTGNLGTDGRPGVSVLRHR